MLIVLALVSWIGCIESQEKQALIPKGNTQDEEAGFFHSHNVIISHEFLPLINSHEAELAARSIAHEMKWLEDFYNAAMVNPNIIKTREQEITHKRQVMRALLDHIESKIEQENQQKWGQRSVNCLNPCYQDGQSECLDGAKNCCLIGGFLVGFSAWLSSLIILYPLHAGGCEFVNRDNFMNNCSDSSYLHNTPVNVTQMQQEYGPDFWQMVVQACRALADVECEKTVHAYNAHKYPKLELRAWLPTIIGLPTLIAACTACQLVSCKYRRWKDSGDRLRRFALEKSNDMDTKIERMNKKLSEHSFNENMISVD